MHALINVAPVSALPSYIIYGPIKLHFKTKRKAICSLVMQMLPVYYLCIQLSIDPYYVNSQSSTGLPMKIIGKNLHKELTVTKKKFHAVSGPLQHCKAMFCVMATSFPEEQGVKLTMKKNVPKPKHYPA